MNVKSRKAVVAVVGVVSFVSGIAVAQVDLMMQRYQEAEANIAKGNALLNAITPNNAAEKKQRNKALHALANAEKAVACAEARRTDAGAACP